MATPPTLATYVETAWNTTASPKTSASISWNAGDVIVVMTMDDGQATLGLPTLSGVTFVNQKSNNAVNTCSMRIDAVVAGSSGSGTVSNTSSTLVWGFAVWVYSGSGGIGNSAEQHTATRTLSLTPTAADSAIIWAVADFAAAAVQTITPTPTNTEEATDFGTTYTGYVADLTDQTSAGATSYGIGGSGVGPFSIQILEIKGSAGGGATTQKLPALGVG